MTRDPLPPIAGLSSLGSALQRRLPALISAADALGTALVRPGPWVGEDRALADSIAAAISPEEPAAPRWLGLLVLESPRLRRIARVRLTAALAPRGIPRDLSDLPDVSGLAVASLLALAVRSRTRVLSALLERCEAWISSASARSLTPADSMLLATLLSEGDLSWLREAWKRPAVAAGLELADWLQRIDQDRPAGDVPGTSLARAWLACRAFRGARRAWARRRGARAGAAAILEPEPWVIPLPSDESGPRSEAQCATLVEWTLAAVRARRAPLTEAEAGGLRARVADWVRGSIREDVTRAWLEDSMKILVQTAEVEPFEEISR